MKNNFKLNRRQILAAGTVALLGKTSPCCAAQHRSEQSNNELTTDQNKNPFRICLNTGTLNGYQLSLEEELKTARQSGYRSVEIWLNRLQDYLNRGKSLADLKKWLDDNEMTVESAIGFATWIVNEPEKRQQGQDQMRREMELLAQLETACIAAPAAGPWNQKIEEISVCADRYRNILEIGDEIGVRPLLELWGTSPTLSRISDLLAIAAETGHRKAGVLLDVYHLFRGGNAFETLHLISGSAMPVFHINDYPAEPAREKLTDGDRLFPGDGIAPLSQILTTLKNNGFQGALSLELFNDHYCKSMKPEELARIGYQKIQHLIDTLH